MKFIQKLTNEQFAKSAAGFMKIICQLSVFFFVLCTVLSFMERQTFYLHTPSDSFESAIYAEENHAPHSRSMTVHTGDDIHVWTNDSGEIDLTVQIGLSLMYAVNSIPMIIAFWFLGRVFSNIREGQIFTDQNAAYLLYYGLLQFWTAVIVPFLVCWLINLISDSRMSISPGQAMFDILIPSIAFIVAAYIVHYGVHLQNEVEHTL